MPACSCTEKMRPLFGDLPKGSNDRPRQWFVIRRNYTRSAFNGYAEAWSDYSDLSCRVCGAYWRSKAPHVAKLQDCEFWPSKNPPKVEPYAEL
jgi:hypothetical protein